MNQAISQKKKAGNIVFYGSILSFIGYSLQGVVYQSGTTLSQAMLLIYLIFGAYCFLVRLPKRNKSMAENAMLCFLLLVSVTFVVSPKIVHGVTYEAIGRVSTWGQYKNIVCFCLSFFIGVYCYNKGVVNAKNLSRIGIALIALMIARYVISYYVMSTAYRGRMVQNNASYSVVLCLPFLPLIFKHYKKIAIALILLMIAVVLSAGKRGAVICLAVGLLTMGIYYARTVKINLKTVIVGFVVIVGLSWFVIDQYNKSDLLRARLEMTQKKGLGTRETAYTTLWRHWEENPNLMEKVLGEGTTQSVNAWGNYAHNDWLELLIDNGLLGVVLYALFFMGCVKGVKRFHGNSALKIACLIAIMISLTRSLFSMGFTDLFGGLDMMIIGMTLCRKFPRYSNSNHLIKVNE